MSHTIKYKFNILLSVIIFLMMQTNNSISGDLTDKLKPTISKWRFAVLGDTHVPSSDTVSEMIPYILADSVDLILVCGDLVDGGLRCTESELKPQILEWQKIFAPVYNLGIPIYAVRGNHEDDANNDIAVWNEVFSGNKAFPNNGPVNETNLSYSFYHKNALFIGLDTYYDIHKINQVWLNSQLTSSTTNNIFVFAHEAAFKVFHTDCLDDFSENRNLLWESLKTAGVKAYFCGHDHFYDVSKIDDGDGDSENDIYQCLVGSSGGWLMNKYNYNGENSNYSPKPIIHKREHGYAVVEITDDGETTKVDISWKGRVFEVSDNKFVYFPITEVISYTLKSKTSISVEANKKFELIPNPSYDYFEIRNYEGEIEIYDLSGKFIAKHYVDGASKVNTSTLISGTYICKYGSKSIVFNIIK